MQHFDAKPIEDNIYNWRVRMYDFDMESSLGQQLRDIKRKFNYVMLRKFLLIL